MHASANDISNKDLFEEIGEWDIDDYASMDLDEIFDYAFSKSSSSKKSHDIKTYVDVIFNDHFYDACAADFKEDLEIIHSSELKQVMKETLKQELADQIDDSDDCISLELLNKIGIENSFEPSNMDLKIKIPYDLKQEKYVDVAKEKDWFNEDGIEVVESAKTSGFVNLYLESEYRNDDYGQNNGYRLDGSAVYTLNHDNWILQGNTYFDFFSERAARYYRGSTQLMHPIDNKKHILKIGDINYTILDLFSYQPLLGISYSSFYDVDPYTKTQYLGDSSILLKEDAEVEIFVNGDKTTALRLESGFYNFQSFPLTNGFNDVELRIKDQTGSIENIKFDVVSFRENLSKGLSDFSYNLGLKSTIEDRRLVYTKHPFLSLNHRHGFTNRFTSVSGIQLAEQYRLLVLGTDYGTKFGLINYKLGSWFPKKVSNVSFSNIFRYSYIPEQPHHPSITAQLQNNQKRFKRDEYYYNYNIDDHYDLQKIIKNDFRFTISKKFFHDLNLHFHYNQFNYYNSYKSRKYIGISLLKKLRNLNINASIKYNSEDDDWFLHFSCSLPHGHHNFSNFYIDNIADSFFYEFSHVPPGINNGVSYQIRQISSKDDRDINFNIDYENYRSKIGFFGSKSEKNRNYIGLNFSSALVYADKDYAISKPIHNSFTIITSDNIEKGNTVGINPMVYKDKVYYSSAINKRGAAVINDIPHYKFYNLAIDNSNLPYNLQMESKDFVVKPKLCSGVKIKLKDHVSDMAKFKLFSPEGEPLVLAQGYLEDVDDPRDSKIILTNRSGVAIISDVVVGKTYKITILLDEDEELSKTITVPSLNGTQNIINLGSIILDD